MVRTADLERGGPRYRSLRALPSDSPIAKPIRYVYYMVYGAMVFSRGENGSGGTVTIS